MRSDQLSKCYEPLQILRARLSPYRFKLTKVTNWPFKGGTPAVISVMLPIDKGYRCYLHFLCDCEDNISK